MASTSWSGRRWSSPAARRGRALARGLEGRFPLQHHYVSDQNGSSSRCWAYFSLALKHGIYRTAPAALLAKCAPCRSVHVRAAGRRVTLRVTVYSAGRHAFSKIALHCSRDRGAPHPPAPIWTSPLPTGGGLQGSIKNLRGKKYGGKNEVHHHRGLHARRHPYSGE